jgi:hypothetical protein
MSVSNLLNPETQNEGWSHLYANVINVNVLGVSGNIGVSGSLLVDQIQANTTAGLTLLSHDSSKNIVINNSGVYLQSLKYPLADGVSGSVITSNGAGSLSLLPTGQPMGTWGCAFFNLPGAVYSPIPFPIGTWQTASYSNLGGPLQNIGASPNGFILNPGTYNLSFSISYSINGGPSNITWGGILTNNTVLTNSIVLQSNLGANIYSLSSDEVVTFASSENVSIGLYNQSIAISPTYSIYSWTMTAQRLF